MNYFKGTKILSIVLMIMYLFSCFTVSANSFIAVILNGSALEFDVHPTLINGRTMVPMRTIFESLGAEVSWDASSNTAIGVKEGINIRITIGNSSMLKNGVAYNLDSPAIIIDGRTLVPVRAIAESFNCEVKWDNKKRTVHIFSYDKDMDIWGENVQFWD